VNVSHDLKQESRLRLGQIYTEWETGSDSNCSWYEFQDWCVYKEENVTRIRNSSADIVSRGQTAIHKVLGIDQAGTSKVMEEEALSYGP